MKARNIFKKVEQAFNQHLKPTTLENEFIPNNGVKHGDLKRYWNHYNVELINKISNIKNEKI